MFRSSQTLFPFQADEVALTYLDFADNKIPSRLLLFDTGTGKQQPISEPVLTPSGWTPIGSIEVGDRVIGRDGKPTTVLSVYPQINRETYKVTFSDGSWTRCGPDHLWEVGRWKTFGNPGQQRREWYTEVISTKEIINRGVKTSKGRRKFSIPIADPVQFDPIELPMDPYALGVILGDGSVNENGHLGLTTDEEIISGFIADGGGRIVSHKSDGIGVFSTSRWKNPLTELGLHGHRSYEKFIPDLYLRASEDDRWALLAGLLDTDGSPCPAGGVEFSSTSEALADGVVELVHSLGGIAKKSPPRITQYTYKNEKKDGRPSWRVNVKTNRQPHRLTRKAERWVQPTKYPVARWIESIEKVDDEESVCIRVSNPDGLYLTRQCIVTHNTTISIAIMCLLIEDELIDHVLMVGEANKIDDFASDDIPKFSELSVGLYRGTPSKRDKILADPPQVMVMSYETGRNDICGFKGRKAVAEERRLTKWARGKRVLIVFDEFSKLRNRSSKSYVAWDYLVNRVLRKSQNQPYIVGLTATSVEKHPEDHWNAGRLIAPDMAGSVGDFNRDYIGSYDQFGNPRTWKNLTPHKCQPGVTPLNQMFARITSVKSKTDPDVIDQFPSRIENPPTKVVLSAPHQEFYDRLSDLLAEAEFDNPMEERQAVGLLRQAAAHPGSLLLSRGQMARQIVGVVGEEYLRSINVAKIEAMLRWQESMENQQTVIFTFYGGSVLPYLHTALVREGYQVSVNTGSMSMSERKDSRDAYIAGDTQIFLSSDAGAKGLNLGVGSGLLHYETPLTYATFKQRSDRIHRIDSKHPSVTIDYLLAHNTIEVPLARKMIKRNEWGEQVQDSEWTEDSESDFGVLTAKDRQEMLNRVLA